VLAVCAYPSEELRRDGKKGRERNESRMMPGESECNQDRRECEWRASLAIRERDGAGHDPGNQ
jgi:hypothetical protein